VVAIPPDIDPASLAAALAAGTDVLITSAGPGDSLPATEDPAVAERLAESILAVARHAPSAALVVVGGELGSALLWRAGSGTLRVLAEPWPAAVVLEALDGVLGGRLVVVKSGSQGGPTWLTDAVQHLRGRRGDDGGRR
jgi:uncharacterized protein YgbK (DUF1537 family)